VFHSPQLWVCHCVVTKPGLWAASRLVLVRDGTSVRKGATLVLKLSLAPPLAHNLLVLQIGDDDFSFLNTRHSGNAWF
jgi:hypothetical protein